MKILFIGTSSDYSLAHLKKLHQKENIVAIVEAAPRGANEQAERGKWWKSRLAIFAKLHHINYCYTAKLSSTESETFIRSTNCDLICIASCPQLIKENIISIPNYGVINSHDSLLPQYRGANPLYWTFYNWEKVGGNTIHYIDVGEDTGDILLQRSFDIPFGISYRKYRKKSMVNGALMMAEVVVQIKEGTVNPQKQVLTSPCERVSGVLRRITKLIGEVGKRVAHITLCVELIIGRLLRRGVTVTIRQQEFPEKNPCMVILLLVRMVMFCYPIGFPLNAVSKVSQSSYFTPDDVRKYYDI